MSPRRLASATSQCSTWHSHCANARVLFSKRVLDRVEMDVIRVARAVPIVPDGVLPEPPSPNAALAPLHLHCGALFIYRNGFCGGLFQCPPAPRVVIVPGWKGPDAMHVVGQHDPGIHVERRTGPNITDGVAENVDVGDKQPNPAVEQVDGEEVGPSQHSVAAVGWHRTNFNAKSGTEERGAQQCQ